MFQSLMQKEMQSRLQVQLTLRKAICLTFKIKKKNVFFNSFGAFVYGHNTGQ
jgi:hypothetical protein